MHPRLPLCELDVSTVCDEAEVQFVESHGAKLFEVGVQINEDVSGLVGDAVWEGSV